MEAKQRKSLLQTGINQYIEFETTEERHILYQQFTNMIISYHRKHLFEVKYYVYYLFLFSSELKRNFHLGKLQEYSVPIAFWS